MTDNAKSAGIAILNYAYHTCDQFAVPRSEIAELLTELRDAVIIGQHDKPVLPDRHPEPGRIRFVTQDTVTAMHQLHKAGMTLYGIAQTLGIDWRTVERYIKDGIIEPLHRAPVTASLPEPQSDPASG